VCKVGLDTGGGHKPKNDPELMKKGEHHKNIKTNPKFKSLSKKEGMA